MDLFFLFGLAKVVTFPAFFFTNFYSGYTPKRQKKCNFSCHSHYMSLVFNKSDTLFNASDAFFNASDTFFNASDASF